MQGPGREGNKGGDRLACPVPGMSVSAQVVLEGGLWAGPQTCSIREVKRGSLNTHCVLVCDQVERTGRRLEGHLGSGHTATGRCCFDQTQDGVWPVLEGTTCFLHEEPDLSPPYRLF